MLNQTNLSMIDNHNWTEIILFSDPPGLMNVSHKPEAVNYFPDFNNPIILVEAIFLGLMILLTISGNLLVIVAVVPSPTLRSPTHSLIVNLAVADLLLGELKVFFLLT